MPVDYQLVLEDLRSKRAALDEGIKALESIVRGQATEPAPARAPRAARPEKAAPAPAEVKDCPGCGRKTGQFKECAECSKELCARKCLRGSKTTCSDCAKRPG